VPVTSRLSDTCTKHSKCPFIANASLKHDHHTAAGVSNVTNISEAKDTKSAWTMVPFTVVSMVDFEDDEEGIFFVCSTFFCI